MQIDVFFCDNIFHISRYRVVTKFVFEWNNFLMIIRLLNPSFHAICKAKMDTFLAQSVVLPSFNLRLPKSTSVHTIEPCFCFMQSTIVYTTAFSDRQSIIFKERIWCRLLTGIGLTGSVIGACGRPQMAHLHQIMTQTEIPSPSNCLSH